MRLNFERHGAAQDGPPLLLAHGLLGRLKNFGALARRFGRMRPVISVDMRNHGDSPHADAMDYRAMGEDLARTLAALTDQPADVLGHSMGGKAAMALALSAPERVRRLIVADIAPIAYDHDHSDMIDAMLALDLSQITRRAQAEAGLEAVVPHKMMRAFLLQNLEIDAQGARWKPALRTLRNRMPDLVGFPHDLLRRRFDGPALFLRGGASDYVPDSARGTILTLFPKARIETIDGAAHWLHADNPAAFIAATEAFLA